MGLSIKQRVKVNAALSMIHAQGYDAQTVMGWAKEYQRRGYDDRRAIQQALNEFAAGQPDIGVSIGKITRLVEASDVPTVAKYDVALSSYIATGDDSALVALAPMIAADSVALAVKHGEATDSALTGESIEAALGFAMADELVEQAANPQAPQDAAQQAPQARPEGAPQAVRQATFAFNPGAAQGAQDPTASQVSAAAGGGRIVNQAKWDAAPIIGAVGSARTLLAGARRGDNGLSDRAPQRMQTKAEIKAQHVNQGVKPSSETI